MKTDLSSHIKLDQVSKRLYRPESEVELASLTRCERVYTKVVETIADGAADAAADVAQTIERCVREKGRCVIGFGAGKCALAVYDELVKLYFADKVSFANVVAFNISELGLGVPGDDSLSTLARLKQHLYNKVDIEPHLTVGFGAVDVDDAGTDDDVLVVDRSESELNLNQFVYDYICLGLPLVKLHPEGKCNPEMLRYLSGSEGVDTESEESSRPFEGLKDLLENKNN